MPARDSSSSRNGACTNSTVPAFLGARITDTANGMRTLRYKDGRTATFTLNFGMYPVGLPLAFADANGNQLTLTRPQWLEWVTAAITDATGRGLTFTRVYGYANRVETVSNPLGRTVTYQYDASGRLISVTNPAGGVTQYTYDRLHRMTAITDARGITYLTNTYDTNYRVCQQDSSRRRLHDVLMTTDIVTTPATVQLSSEAAAGGPISQTPCSGTGSMNLVVATVLVDQRGKPTTYRVNGIGALISTTDALGQTTTWQRDSATNLVQSMTDPLNRLTCEST